MLGAVALFRPNNPTRVEAAGTTEDFVEAAKNMGGFDTFGYRLSNAWSDEYGSSFVAYQRAILQKGWDNKIKLRPILDEISRLGLDQSLYDGRYGIVVPKRQKILDWEYPVLSADIAQAAAILKEQGADPGDSTSHPTDFGPFEVTRFQSLAIQKWSDGKVENILVGDAVLKMGIIPPEAILDIPQLDNQKDPLKCGNGPTWEGIATYYSTEGCVGCNPERRMANNEILDDNRLTIAFMRTPLDVPVVVENLETELSVRAMVTDRGGFERYGKIADLSLGLRNAIGGSDLTRVRISLLDCR